MFWLWFSSGIGLFATHAVVKGRWFAASLWFLGHFVVASATLQISLATICPSDWASHDEFLHGVVMALYLGGAFATVANVVLAFALKKRLVSSEN